MPEATMHEYSRPVLWQQHVGSARQFTGMEAKPQPGLMQMPAHLEFGLSIPRPNAPHNPASGPL